MKFKEELLTGDRICVHCPTEDQSITFLTWLEKKGKLWRDGGLPTANLHRQYGDETSYLVCGIEYADVSFYKREGYTVVSYKDALASRLIREL